MEPLTNIEDMCRICGTSTSGMVRHFIFQESETHQTLHTKIILCLPIEIRKDDLLPKFLCGECIYKVNMLHDLRAVSLKTDYNLKQLLSQKNSIQNQESPTYYDPVIPQDQAVAITDDANSNSFESIKVESVNPVKKDKNIQDFEHFMTKKQPHHSNVKITTENRKKENEAITINEETTEQKTSDQQVRKRPMRAVRLNSEISYSSDSILEKLLKKNSSQQPKKVKKSFGRYKKTVLKQCKFCKLVLPSREYQSHITDEHKKQYECNVCKNRFPGEVELDEHREITHHSITDKAGEDLKGVRLLKCNMCQKTYLRKHLLVLHMRRHTGERPFPCHLCERKYACKSSLNSHLLKHKEEWKHVCNFCGKGFVDKHSFIYHVRSNHTGERPFACDKCDRKFIKKQDLLKHIQTQHSEMPKELFSCEECGRVCKDYDSLRSHKRSHIPVEERRVHKCTLCEASFTGKTGLMKHMHRHTGEMPYECEQCAKRFFTKKGLELHLVIHSGVKSFICEYCGRAFSQDNTLRVHRRTHTGERPYECNICMKRFTQSSALNSHKKLHSKE